MRASVKDVLGESVNSHQYNFKEIEMVTDNLETHEVGDRFIFMVKAGGVKIESTVTYVSSASARSAGFKFLRRIGR